MLIQKFDYSIKGQDRLKTICTKSPLFSDDQHPLKIGSFSCVRRCPAHISIDFEKKEVCCKK